MDLDTCTTKYARYYSITGIMDSHILYYNIQIGYLGYTGLKLWIYILYNNIKIWYLDFTITWFCNTGITWKYAFDATWQKRLTGRNKLSGFKQLISV